MTDIALQIAATGAMLMVVVRVVTDAIGDDCPSAWIAAPIMAAYFVSFAAMVGGFLWWVWA